MLILWEGAPLKLLKYPPGATLIYALWTKLVEGMNQIKKMGKNCHYKFFWIGDELGHGYVGILIKKMGWISFINI